MSHKTSRNKRRALNRGRKRFIAEDKKLPIEIWRLIFLHVPSTGVIRKVSRSFRTTVLDPHFDERHSLNWNKCKVIGCGHRGEINKDHSKSRRDYCSLHECRMCYLNPSKPKDIYCDDCKLTCKHPDCDNISINSKGYMEVPGFGYCNIHGCNECGREREKAFPTCFFCHRRWLWEDTFNDYRNSLL